MNQDHPASTELAIKSPTTLETVPADVISFIVECIKNWAKVEGNLQEREKARRARDSALRAVILSSRKFHSLIFPILLQNVTVDEVSILSFYYSLKTNPELGNLVQHFRYGGGGASPDDMSDEEIESLCSNLALLSDVNVEDKDAQSYFGLLQVSKFIFEKLGSLQTLIMESPHAFPVTFNLPSFTNSLKRLYVPYWETTSTRPYPPLNTRNVVWLLRFGPAQEVSLAFSLSVSDFDFLSEHYCSFSATSRVKKLSLQYVFVHEDSEDQVPWWDRIGEVGKPTDNKTLALRRLFRITDRLECLELYPVYQERKIGVPLNLQCLPRLDRSFKTLQHLRLLSVTSPNPIFNDYRSFCSLKSLSLDITMLYFMAHDSKLQLPVTLERIILTYYILSHSHKDLSQVLKEEWFLMKLLNGPSVQSLPNFKEVFVPSHAVDEDGCIYDALEFSSQQKVWAERRELLASNAIFSDGKVRLRTYNPGEAVTSDAETFMSTELWLSPPQL